MKTRLTFSALLIFLIAVMGLGSQALAQKKKEEGKLGDFEKQVEKKKPSSDDDDDDDDDDDCCPGAGVDSFLNSYFVIETSVRTAVGLLIYFPHEDSLLYNGDVMGSRYSDFPYQDEYTGRFTRDGGKKFALEFSGGYFYSETDLTGMSIRSKFSPTPLFNVSVFFSDLTEQLRTRKDHLQLYSAFINYNRLRVEKAAIWWGLGFKGLNGDEVNTGFAFNVGGEFYLAKPLSLHLNYNGGWINNTFLPEFYGALNVHIDRFALFGGYQYWSAGPISIDGLVSGVKVYF